MRGRRVRYAFEDYVINSDRRELTRSAEPTAVGPQVFDLLLHLVRNREHVVSKDELLDAVWAGRIVSEIDPDHPNQRGAQGYRRHRAEPAPASNDRPQGIPIRRRRQRDSQSLRRGQHRTHRSRPSQRRRPSRTAPRLPRSRS